MGRQSGPPPESAKNTPPGGDAHQPRKILFGLRINSLESADKILDGRPEHDWQPDCIMGVPCNLMTSMQVAEMKLSQRISVYMDSIGSIRELQAA
jgi:hypothetical protein